MIDHRDTPQLDPHLAAIERRLEPRVSAKPPAALRRRVLAAVDDVFITETVSATSPPRAATARRRASADAMAGTAISGWAWAAAAVLGLAMTAPIVTAVEALRRCEGPSVALQLRAAGVADEPLLTLVARGRLAGATIQPRYVPHQTPRHTMSRVIELRRLLEETL